MDITKLHSPILIEGIKFLKSLPVSACIQDQIIDSIARLWIRIDKHEYELLQFLKKTKKQWGAFGEDLKPIREQLAKDIAKLASEMRKIKTIKLDCNKPMPNDLQAVVDWLGESSRTVNRNMPDALGLAKTWDSSKEPVAPAQAMVILTTLFDSLTLIPSQDADVGHLYQKPYTPDFAEWVSRQQT